LSIYSLDLSNLIDISSGAPTKSKKPAIAERWRPAVPYNQLPPLPPRADLETRTILKKCILARAALAELKQPAELIPNQSMLINTLPLLEARASSEIENIVTTTDRPFQFREDDKHADPANPAWVSFSFVLDCLKECNVCRLSPPIRTFSMSLGCRRAYRVIRAREWL
jgi:hypothetical protein